MPRLEDNSYASRQERERAIQPVERVTTGKAVVKKKTFGRKVLDLFLSEKIDDVGDYITHSVIGPGIKSLLYDMVNSAISMMFWGDPNVRRNSRRDGGGSRANDYWRASNERGRSSDRGRRPAYDYDDIIFETRDDAERVLDRLFDQLERYGKARVADLYEAAGLSPDGNYTVNYYGWYSLRGAGVYPTSEGWAIDLPKCESLR